MIKFRLFSETVSYGCHFYRCFKALFPPQVTKEGFRGLNSGNFPSLLLDVLGKKSKTLFLLSGPLLWRML